MHSSPLSVLQNPLISLDTIEDHFLQRIQEVWYKGNAYLDEPDVLRLFPEALAADVEAILANETSGVGADAAKRDSHKHKHMIW